MRKSKVLSATCSRTPCSRDSRNRIFRLLEKKHLRYLDIIPRDSLEEKIVHLVLEGNGPWHEVGAVFDDLLADISRFRTDGIRVVVFGGGTGLSSVLGGDTALPSWPEAAFGGLKRLFPRISVGVCVTDDGGSSGILLRHPALCCFGGLAQRPFFRQ